MSNESNEPVEDNDLVNELEEVPEEEPIELPIDSSAYLTPVMIAVTLAIFGVCLFLGFGG